MKGNSFDICMMGGDTIDALKMKIEEASKIAVVEQRLTLRGKRIDEGTIDSNQIKNKNTLLLRQAPRSPSSLSSPPRSGSSTPVRTGCLGPGCNFYGDPAKDNLCSRCYEDREQRRKEEEQERKEAEKRLQSEQAARIAAEKEASRPKQTKPTRCFKCNIRVGPAIIHCRCGYGFCATCRYPEQHNCEYDHKTHDKERLMDTFQTVKGDKLKDRT